MYSRMWFDTLLTIWDVVASDRFNVPWFTLFPTCKTTLW
jgi:hypothetical protein